MVNLGQSIQVWQYCLFVQNQNPIHQMKHLETISLNYDEQEKPMKRQNNQPQHVPLRQSAEEKVRKKWFGSARADSVHSENLVCVSIRDSNCSFRLFLQVD